MTPVTEEKLRSLVREETAAAIREKADREAKDVAKEMAAAATASAEEIATLKIKVAALQGLEAIQAMAIENAVLKERIAGLQERSKMLGEVVAQKDEVQRLNLGLRAGPHRGIFGMIAFAPVPFRRF